MLCDFLILFYILQIRDIFKTKKKKKTLLSHGYDETDDRSLDSPLSTHLVEKVIHVMASEQYFATLNCMLGTPESLAYCFYFFPVICGYNVYKCYVPMKNISVVELIEC